MSTMEQIQMERYASELEDDVSHLVHKYQRIMGWSVPDLDEEASRKLILEALHTALLRFGDRAEQSPEASGR